MGPLSLRSFPAVLGVQAVRRRPCRASREESRGALGAEVSAHVTNGSHAGIICAASRALAVHTTFSSSDCARNDGSALSGGLDRRCVWSDARSLSRLQFQRLRDIWFARALFSSRRNPAILPVPG